MFSFSFYETNRLIFGGSFPHYFYKYVEEFLQNAGKAKQMYLFLIERLVFAPVYQALSLYFLSRFEGNNHDFALKNLCKLYWPLLTTNWKYLSLLVFINVKFVPPMVGQFIFYSNERCYTDCRFVRSFFSFEFCVEI